MSAHVTTGVHGPSGRAYCARRVCTPAPGTGPPPGARPAGAPEEHTRRPGSHPMPIATPEVYNEMLDRAKEGRFAYPAINCTSSESVNAALRGFAEAESDGIIQFSTGGSEFGSGLSVKDMV